MSKRKRFSGKVFIMMFFDDGYQEDERIAHMLRQKNMKASFAIAVKNIGREIDKNDLSYLADTGEILSHGVTHTNLVKLLRCGHTDLVYSELMDSKIFLEKLLDTNVEGFVYPYGAYGGLLKRLVKRAGYRYARTIDLPSIAPIIRDKYAISVTMVDYKPTTLQILRSLTKLHFELSNILLDYSIMKLLVGLFSKYMYLHDHASILRLMLVFLKRLGEYVKCYNRTFIISLVFHGNRFSEDSFKIFRTILNYIKEKSSVFKTVTLSQYITIYLRGEPRT